MGKIATLAERALAKAGSVIEKVVPDDRDKAEKMGKAIETIVGKKAFDEMKNFADAAADESFNRRLHKEKDPEKRAEMMLSVDTGRSREFIRSRSDYLGR